jgi:hypothetical protein
MHPLTALARADQVSTLYASWHRTTVSMLLGAAILCGVMWQQEAPWVMAAWVVAILANQAWRGVLVRAYRRAAPPIGDAARWGAYWVVGATFAGALWGFAAIAMFPASPAYQALFIVCQFGVILGGLSRTAVYKPAFYGFVLAVLVPLIARVAIEGDQVHLFTAGVLGVVLVFVLAFGRQVNDVLTQSLMMRYENVDLIRELKAQTEAALAARVAAETASLAKSQFLAAASHDLRQPLHAMGLFAARSRPRCAIPASRRSLRASARRWKRSSICSRSFSTCRNSMPERCGLRRRLRAAAALRAACRRLRAAGAGGGTLAAHRAHALTVVTDPSCSSACCAISCERRALHTRRRHRAGRAARPGRPHRRDRFGRRHRRMRHDARLRRVRAARRRAAQSRRRTRDGTGLAIVRRLARFAATRSSSLRRRDEDRAFRSRCHARRASRAADRRASRARAAHLAHAAWPPHRRRRRRSGGRRRQCKALFAIVGCTSHGRRRRPQSPQLRTFPRQQTRRKRGGLDRRRICGSPNGKSGIDAHRANFRARIGADTLRSSCPVTRVLRAGGKSAPRE